MDIIDIHNTTTRFDVDSCIREYLAFQHTSMGWREGVHSRTYLEYTECPRTHKVTSGHDAVNALKKVSKVWTDNFDPSKIGILISSGIDSATVSKMLKPGSYAFFATYKERDTDPEIDRVREYCEINQLNLIVVDVSWEDYDAHVDFLMRIKKAPIHPCEIPVYLCCRKAQELGVEVVFSGWGADTHFGGMDKLLSRDWTLEDFKARYEYCPRLPGNNAILNNAYQPFLSNDGAFNTHDFLTFNYHVMTLRSFFYIPEMCGLLHVSAWGYLGLRNNLDLTRVRNCEPKYIIQETFNLLYKDSQLRVTEKLPFTRPTDIYMRLHFDDFEYNDILKSYIDEHICKLTSQQKWMVYILNRFLHNIIRQT